MKEKASTQKSLFKKHRKNKEEKNQPDCLMNLSSLGLTQGICNKIEGTVIKAGVASA